MKRRNGFPAYFLILIACIAVLFLLFRQRFPFGKNNTAFAVEEKTDISRIAFFEGEKKLVLIRKEGEWIIEKDTVAREEAVLFLLKVLKEMKIKSPVTSEMFLEEIAGKKTEPVKVHVYDGRRLRKSYFVYRTFSNAYGNIMKMKPHSKPFIMYVPGYETNIGEYFTASRLFWRPFIVFNFLPSEIDHVYLYHRNDTASSFRIVSAGRNLFLQSRNGRLLQNYDTVKVRRYISYFAYIPFERWATELDNVKKKEIKSSEPLYRIEVKNRKGKIINLSVWEKTKIAGNGADITDTDRVWAGTDENEEIFVMRYFDIDPLLKRKSYFFDD